jgi:diguanylate cyclase (GGDEF)-like protein
MDLPARVPFGTTIDRQIVSCRRYGSRFAVLCLAIDNLGAVEQRYGPLIEHKLLCAAWARLAAGLRAQDLACHTGRGEFGAVVRNVLAPAAAGIAARITHLLCQPYCIDELEIRLVVSAGCAMYPQDADNGDTLAAAATQARLRGGAMAAGLRCADRFIRLDS